MLYIVTLNYDYDESIHVFRARPAAVEFIRETFEVDDEIPSDSPEFWREVSDIYGMGDWKGLQFVTLDPETLKISNCAEGI